MRERELDRLLSDDSFIHFCSGTNELDQAYWEAYLIANPHLRKEIEKLKELVLYTAATGLVKDVKQPAADHKNSGLKRGRDR
ncbi:hypothetical protein KJS94_18055 [Flavihumibacter rivuli]|uniref:hypothetical protein n=1 Tax=Flavihumibacter rivuli TaxID=2838156 RepID=UPI001BDF5772|nr:hypothetical protein [Flavihumibacter rivuli]ULQ56559.1 hypothetical protein KJS94_18055 [Flavihumibacter rivuli]